jgi:hypothetical protein
MHPPYRGLAFLLSIGSLPIACGKENGESDTNANDPTSGSDGSSSGSVSGTTTTGGSATTGTPTTGASDSVSGTSGEPTTGNNSQGFITTDTTGATGGDTETVPPVTDPTCLAYAANIVMCYPRYADYRQMLAYNCVYYKAYGLRLDGQACADAFEAMFICFSTLSCEDFMNEETPCEKEVATLKQDCPSLPEEGSSSGGDTMGDTGGTGGSSSSSSTG